MSNKNLKAIILAAGKGTRMKSSTPKVLHKILGKALLERVVDSVLNIDNTSEIITIIGHQSEQVSNFIDSKYSSSSIPVTSVLQYPQLGTGDAVFKAYDKLKDFDGNILILCGDTPLLTTETLSGFIKSHDESKSSLTILSAKVDNPRNYGRIVRDSNNNVKRIVEEKDTSSKEKNINEINAGVYCIDWKKISPAFFDLKTNNSQGEYYLTDIVDWASNQQLKVEAYTLNDMDEVMGINSKIDLANASEILNRKTLNALMENGVTIIDPKNTWISPETQIGQDTVVYPGCYIMGENIIGQECSLGPNLFIDGDMFTGNNVKLIQSKISKAKIMDNSTIGPFAHLRDYVEISNNVRVGNFVELKKTVVDEFTNISHLSYVGDSTVGKNVNIGAGTITANYNPLTKVKSQTVIEDGVKIGSNSVLIAPVKLEKDSNVAAGSVITKNVPQESLAIAREKQKNLENWVKVKSERNNK